MRFHGAGDGRRPARASLATVTLAALIAATGASPALAEETTIPAPEPTPTVSQPATPSPQPSPTTPATGEEPSPSPEPTPSPSPDPSASEGSPPPPDPSQKPSPEPTAEPSSGPAPAPTPSRPAPVPTAPGPIAPAPAPSDPAAEPGPSAQPQPSGSSPGATATPEPAWFGGIAAAPRLITPEPVRTTFLDVSSDPRASTFSPFAEAIQWLAEQGAGLGWGLAENAARFEPDATATRADVATFLYRAAGLPLQTPPETSPYSDVPSDHPAYTEIAWLAEREAGLTDDATFRPDDPATLGDAARAMHALADAPRVVIVYGLSFDPPPARSPYADATEWLEGLGVPVPQPADDGSDDALRRPASRGAVAALVHAAHEAGVVLSDAPSIATRLLATDEGLPSGTLENGRLPASALCSVPWDRTARLSCAAAADLERLNASFRAAFDLDVPIGSSYRDLAGQYSVRASHGELAAIPGTSQHGWGKAIDLDAGRLPGGYAGAAYWWLVRHGQAFGWVLPDWASPLGSKPEPWHFEHVN